jgi:hypothetical protein
MDTDLEKKKGAASISNFILLPSSFVNPEDCRRMAACCRELCSFEKSAF